MSRYISRKSPSKRLTIVIDEIMEEKLRELQGSLITSERRNFSLSKIVYMVLVSGLMASDRLTAQEWMTVRSIVHGKRAVIDQIPSREYVVNISAMAELV